jgi:hypothetical protein
VDKLCLLCFVVGARDAGSLCTPFLRRTALTGTVRLRFARLLLLLHVNWTNHRAMLDLSNVI